MSWGSILYKRERVNENQHAIVFGFLTEPIMWSADKKKKPLPSLFPTIVAYRLKLYVKINLYFLTGN